MKLDDIKDFLNELSNDPALLDSDSTIIEATIHEIIRAEKKYSYGLDLTTQNNRHDEIERIVLNSLEAASNENKKD
ncbi:hypothetical protein ACK6SG_11210 [Enterobacter hormaechei]|jgi:hypothetical protein|uniref:hypothetical protein n=1 Tax=Enterobacter TaxID=547 RepID=UPI000F8326BE|nr:hypothetical protein [Enterobacter bugandensis]RTN92191.1 hypothetical protein EKN79_05230 [Enterobacter bugandensis]